MDVSVGIMAFNEEGNISRLLEALLNQDIEEIRIKEVIVVSDGSTDKTDEIIARFMKKVIYNKL